MKKNYSEEFELKWLENKKRLLNEDPEYKKAVEAYQMKSGADWLLFGIPVVVGIVCMQIIPIQHEILLWVVSIAITILAFVLCVMVKSMMNPHRAIEDIEADVKERYYQQLNQKGS